MTRRLTLLVTLLLPLIAIAQMAVGGWELLTPFNGVTDIIETQDKVYYLSGAPGSASLFSYDKKNDETYAYNNGNKLNDGSIQFIKYNPEKKYLLIAYASSNIDILKDDGTVINMPDIKDASLAVKKNITCVGFDPEYDNIYVGTNFGMVRFNDKRFEVVETGMYDVSIDLVGIVGDHLVVKCNNDLRVIGRDKYIARLANFKNLKYQMQNREMITDIRPIKDNRAIILTGQKMDSGAQNAFFLDINFDDYTCKQSKIRETMGNITGLGHFKDAKDTYTIHSSGAVVAFDRKTGEPTWTQFPLGASSNHCGAIWDAKDMIWVGHPAGINGYSMKAGSDGKLPLIHENIKASDLTLSQIRQLHAAPDGTIYMADHLPTRIGPDKVGAGTVNVITPDGDILDYTISEYPKTVAGAANSKLWMGYLTPDFKDSQTYWFSQPNWSHEYVMRVRDNKYDYILTDKNRPEQVESPWYPSHVAFDGKGNLWVAAGFNTSTPLLMLPASKTGLDDIKASDWQVSKDFGISFNHDTRMAVCKHSNAIILVDSRYGGYVAGYNTKGTDSLGDDVMYDYTTLVDQDGKTFSSTVFSCVIEDKKGRVWIGTGAGIIEITDPETFSLNPGTRINHLKVPRNDGTNFADYLLDMINVSDIAVDGLNRKWVSTIGSGVYLVSEDGKEIIANYNTDNSPLPTNDVYSVVCDPQSNKVYFGTLNGLVVYNSTSSPAAENYDNVYAYPNPVRPEYTGWITVTGLKENSLVKIADAQGNVFYSGRSEGGMITWDGCNNDGQRVKTGVYFVFASQSEEGTSGVVTKILVVN